MGALIMLAFFIYNFSVCYTEFEVHNQVKLWSLLNSRESRT